MSLSRLLTPAALEGLCSCVNGDRNLALQGLNGHLYGCVAWSISCSFIIIVIAENINMHRILGRMVVGWQQLSCNYLLFSFKGSMHEDLYSSYLVTVGRVHCAVPSLCL